VTRELLEKLVQNITKEVDYVSSIEFTRLVWPIAKQVDAMGSSSNWPHRICKLVIIGLFQAFVSQAYNGPANVPKLLAYKAGFSLIDDLNTWVKQKGGLMRDDKWVYLISEQKRRSVIRGQMAAKVAEAVQNKKIQRQANALLQQATNTTAPLALVQPATEPTVEPTIEPTSVPIRPLEPSTESKDEKPETISEAIPEVGPSSVGRDPSVSLEKQIAQPVVKRVRPLHMPARVSRTASLVQKHK
jgi:hypothetical protein